MIIESVKKLSFQRVSGKDSWMTVYESPEMVPFNIKRTFVVSSLEKVERGKHAHKQCSQLLVALKGSCTVLCDDGCEKKEFLLNNPAEGLLVPPSIWAEQAYEKDTILMVLTDRPYEEEDYLRDYDDFLMFRKAL